MEALLRSLRQDHPTITFVAALKPSWSPRKHLVQYNPHLPHAPASLLHELAHAILGHQTFANDLDLLAKEVTAWEQATALATQYKVILDTNFIQDCLDTYRDWLHKRSTCPQCAINGLQRTPTIYHCFNCGKEWHVSRSRHCRPYRRSMAQT